MMGLLVLSLRIPQLVTDSLNSVPFVWKRVICVINSELSIGLAQAMFKAILFTEVIIVGIIM